MIRPKTLDDVRRVTDSERDALVAAAVLPNLADDEALVRLRPEDDRRPWFDHSGEEFVRRVTPIAGRNLRRVRKIKTTYRTNKHDVPVKVNVEPTPHSIRRYTIGTDSFDVICPREDGEYDFDDTDQTELTDFGVTPSAIDAVHLGVRRTDDTFARKPRFPV